MRKGWLALPILVCATACSPLKEYQEAARSLRFHLDRVEPSLHLTLPVDRSRMAFKVLLGVDNPSTVPFHVVAFSGDLKLDARGSTGSIGRIELAKAVDLPAGGRAQLETELSFSYQELRDNWVALNAIGKGGAGTGHLEGTLKAQAFGFPIQLPVHTSRAVGSGG